MPRQFFSRTVTAVFSAVFLIASAQMAHASAFGLQTLVAANIGCQPKGTGVGACPDDAGGDQDSNYGVGGPIDGAGLVSISSLTDPFDDQLFTYFAQADASFGSLHAQATGSFDLPTASYRGAAAFALATDQLTLTAPGESGEGTLDVSVLLEGLLEHTGKGGAAVFAGVSAGPDQDLFGPNNVIQGVDGTTLPSDPLTLSVGFVWGQPFYLSMFLGSGVGTQLTCLACNSGDADYKLVDGAGTATADFFNTLTLTGLVPTVNGSPVLNAQFSSASGTQYSVNGVEPVPEPGSLLLLGSGLTFAFRRRRRA